MPAAPPSRRPAAWRPALITTVAALAAAAGLPAAADGAHVHGAAQLRVVVDGGTLEVALETPLDNLLGFERAPRTERERAAVRDMSARLRQAQALLVPTAAAQCSLVSVQLASGVLAPALLGEPAPDAAAPAAAAAKGGGEHADLDATFGFRCAAPAQLQGLDVGLAKAFPGLRRLEVQVAGPKGQSATVLTPGQRTVRW